MKSRRVLFAALLCAIQLAHAQPQNILFLVPHPDDESLALAKPILDAVRDPSLSPHLLLATTGDFNFKSLKAFYNLDPAKGPLDFQELGRTRVKEFYRATGKLGLAESNVASLGYPDGKLMQMRNSPHNELCMEYQAVCKTYERRFVRKSPLGEALGSKTVIPFSGANLIKDLKSTVGKLKPRLIYVSSGNDMHDDHAALFYVLEQVLADIPGANEIEVRAYLVHYGDGNDLANGVSVPSPARDYPFHQGWPANPEEAVEQVPPTVKYLPNPYLNFKLANVADTQIDALPLPDPQIVLSLSLNEIAKKTAALSEHATQVFYSREYLGSFLARNEFFWRYRWDAKEKRLVSF
jgi:LmbE family N-acetylglucosaminyl deacetylase